MTKGENFLDKTHFLISGMMQKETQYKQKKSKVYHNEESLDSSFRWNDRIGQNSALFTKLIFLTFLFFYKQNINTLKNPFRLGVNTKLRLP